MKNLKELKEVLVEKITEADNIVIVGHNNPDFDSIGSALGIANICKNLEKKSYILVNDEFSKLEAGVKNVIIKSQKDYNITDLEEYLNKKQKKDILITTDVNKNNLICIKNCLEEFKKVIVIDHHTTDEHTIATPYQYIKPELSSASEIISQLLIQFKFNFDAMCASHLYAGIRLDTNNFTKNTSNKTFEIAARLIKKGADTSYINNLFIEDFNSDRKVQNLVNYTDFLILNYAITMNELDFYTKEELAKTADYLLRYNTDAGFALGYLEKNIVGISARSKGNVDVGKIMQLLGGGGHQTSGATKIENASLEEVGKQLKKILSPGFTEKKV